MTAFTCSECGGDVLDYLTAEKRVYRHAVRGIDHGPLPVPATRPSEKPAAPRQHPLPGVDVSSEGASRSPRSPAPVRSGAPGSVGPATDF